MHIFLNQATYMYGQGLIKPKRQEGIQLNVNYQTAKCKMLLKINRSLQELTDMSGSTQTGRDINSYYV